MSRVLGLLTLGAVLLVFTSLAKAGGTNEINTPQSKNALKGDFDAFFARLDTNNDGKLSKSEFLKLADRAQEKDRAREKLTVLFTKMDPANQGITKEQLRQFLESRKKKDAK